MNKILLVDDEQTIQLAYRQELEEEGYEVHSALTGKDALKKLKIVSPDLVILDINMPGMSGLELLKKVKEEFPDLTVYMITAYGDEYNFREAQANGCDDYLTKPLNFDVLKARLLN